MNHSSTDVSKQIARIWRGWTTKENAPALERVFRDNAIPGIELSKPKGLIGITLLTLERGSEVEFTTILYFDTLESVKAFAGDDYEKAHIDPAVQPLLLRYDKRVEHHMLKESRNWN